MTTKQFLALLDRHKDALVAEKVLGCSVKGTNPSSFCGCSAPLESNSFGMITVSPPHGSGPFHSVKPYSTDIAAAWEVVETLECGFTLETDHSEPQEWECHWATKEGAFHSRADSAPLAICLAALKTKAVIND